MQSEHGGPVRADMDPAERARVIEELSLRLREVEAGASPVSGFIDGSGVAPGAGVGLDPESEKAIVGHCRYILSLVARRARSIQEMREALARRTEDPEVIEECLLRLERAGVCDDAGFASQWVRQRRGIKKLGTAALRRELLGKGVAPSLIDEALVTEDGEDSEKERCTQLCREFLDKELRTSRGASLERGALTRRIGQKLARRGYSTDLTLFVLSRELDAVGLTWS